MNDLGMHVLHLPLRLGWRPRSVYAVLQDIVQRAPRPRRRARPLRHLGQRDDPRRRRLPAHARDEADRARRDATRGGCARSAWTAASSSPPRARRRSTASPSATAASSGSASRPAASRRSRPSPGRSSSSASPTRSCRCGRPTSPSARAPSATASDASPRHEALTAHEIFHAAQESGASRLPSTLAPVADSSKRPRGAALRLCPQFAGDTFGHSLGRSSLNRTHSRPERPAGGMGEPPGRLRRLSSPSPSASAAADLLDVFSTWVYIALVLGAAVLLALRGFTARRPPRAVARARGRRRDVGDRRADLRARLLRGARPRALPVGRRRVLARLLRRGRHRHRARAARAAAARVPRDDVARRRDRRDDDRRAGGDARVRPRAHRHRAATRSRSRPTSPIRSPTSACSRSSSRCSR